MLVDRERRPHPPPLRHVADAVLGDRGSAAGRGSPRRRAARCRARRGTRPGDRVAERGLAHAVAADHGEHAVLERERHVLQRVRVAVVDVEARRSRGSGPSCAAGGRARTSAMSVRARPCRSPAPRRRSRSPPGVPCLSTRPLCITVTRSTTRSAMSRSCSIRTKPMCARQRAEQRHQLAALGGREPGRRLVEQDQPRRAGERHADLELALLAVRERGHRLVGDVRRAARARAGRRPPRATCCDARGRKKLKRPRATPRTARKRLSRTVRSRNRSDDW